jgi:hypothetical protein
LIADLDTDGVAEAGKIIGIAGHHRGLATDGSGDDDGIDNVGGPGHAAGHASSASDGFVIGDDVATFQHPRDAVLRLVIVKHSPNGKR